MHVYIDDLLVVIYDPGRFFKILKNNYQYKSKGIGNPEYHLRGDFNHDPKGILYWNTKIYIDKIFKEYKRILGGLSNKKSSCPLEGIVILNLIIYYVPKISKLISL